MGTFLAVFFRKTGNGVWTLIAWIAAVLIALTSYHWLFDPAIKNEWPFWTTVACVARSVVFLGVWGIVFIFESQIIALWKKESPVGFYILQTISSAIIGVLLCRAIFHWLSPTYY